MGHHDLVAVLRVQDHMMAFVKGAEFPTYLVRGECGECGEFRHAWSPSGARESVVDGQSDPLRPVKARPRG